MRISNALKGPLFHRGQYRDETRAEKEKPPPSQKAGNPAFGKLRCIGTRIWKSSQGLIYKPGSIHGHRILHLLDHFKANLRKKIHSVFLGTRKDALAIVDKAWSMRHRFAPFTNGEHAQYDIPMGGPVGTRGESLVRIIVRLGTSDFLTAYPVADENRSQWRSVP